MKLFLLSTAILSTAFFIVNGNLPFLDGGQEPLGPSGIFGLPDNLTLVFAVWAKQSGLPLLLVNVCSVRHPDYVGASPDDVAEVRPLIAGFASVWVEFRVETIIRDRIRECVCL